MGKIPWRRKWQPTLVFLSVKSCGQRNLVSYSLWGCKESSTTESPIRATVYSSGWHILSRMRILGPWQSTTEATYQWNRPKCRPALFAGAHCVCSQLIAEARVDFPFSFPSRRALSLGLLEWKVPLLSGRNARLFFFNLGCLSGYWKRENSIVRMVSVWRYFSAFGIDHIGLDYERLNNGHGGPFSTFFWTS